MSVCEKTVPRPEHPEPMLERANWRNLNGEWLFEFDFGVSGEQRGMMKPEAATEYSKKITVPFCPESRLSGIAYKDFIPAVWYKKTVTLSEEEVSAVTLLHFGAVDYETTVYVNGKRAGGHTGGYTSFTLDISRLVKAGENDITVWARDDVRGTRQPVGKQSTTYDSRGCSYTRTTGIWQTVWLEFVPDSYIRTLKYYPDINAPAFDIEALVKGSGELTVKAFFDGRETGSVTVHTCGGSVRLTLPLTEKHLWEAGEGRLYDLEFTFGQDTVKSYAGLREVRVEGRKFLLNGKSVFQRTVLDQGFYPDGIYTAPSDRDLARDVELSMALGFNGARLHQKVFEARFLYHCDKAGYLVWGEQANWGLDITETSGFFGFLPEWSEAVERDFNHPSIIGWCPFNETWDFRGRRQDDRVVYQVYRLTKLLDPTRPVIDVSGGFHVETDIYDQHDYEQRPEVFRASYDPFIPEGGNFRENFTDRQHYTDGQPLFLSEYGGIKWLKDSNSPKNSWGYGDGPKTEDEYFERYAGLTACLIDNPKIMGLCYTQLYDVEQEVNGLYCYDRSPKFDDYSAIIAANKRKAAIED